MGEKYAEYAKVNASISANVNVEIDIPYLKEFNTAKPIMVFDEKVPVEVNSIIDRAQLDICRNFVEIAAGSDVKTAATVIYRLRQYFRHFQHRHSRPTSNPCLPYKC